MSQENKTKPDAPPKYSQRQPNQHGGISHDTRSCGLLSPRPVAAVIAVEHVARGYGPGHTTPRSR